MAFSWNPFKDKSTNDQTTAASGINQHNANQPGSVRNNPNYQTFSQINKDIETIVNSKSVIGQGVQAHNQRWANPTWQTFFDENIMAMPLATNKAERIAQYRKISKYSICDWCLDEIADDFIHTDEDGEFIKLKVPQRLNQSQQNVLQNEFKKYMNLFKLKEDGYNIIKRFLIEGELAWENVISPKYPELGIVGVKFLPAEYYEILIDTKSARPVGIVFDVESLARDSREAYRSSFASSASIFNSISPTTYTFKFSKDTCIPLLFNQVTYINSGEYSSDFLISYPLVEKAKQAYYQLALMEQSAVILRVTRAPERLLFNISTGKMDQNRADEYVRRFANQLKAKKTPLGDGHDIASTYDPVTMLKYFVFGRSDGNDGTSVETVGSTADYDQLGDIEYFLRNFLKQFKIPFSRYKTPENTIERNDTISYEEHSFSMMVMRFQKRFAEGFKRGFITHLKLRDVWNKKGYELKDSDIEVDFVKPVLFDLYEVQKLVDAKMSIYKSFVDQDEISKIICMKKYLGWTDAEIEENFKMLVKEKQLVAIADWLADKISDENPPVGYESPIKLKSDLEAEEKNNGAQKPGSSDDAGEEGGEESGSEDAGESSDAGGGEEAGSEGEAAEEPAEPSFGLG